VSRKVLMLGWEFPPFISGGLGTACYGLTKALDRRGDEVTFVLPKHVQATYASHVDLISPGSVPVHPSLPPPAAVTQPRNAEAAASTVIPVETLERVRQALTRVTTLGLPITAPAPYSSSLPPAVLRLALESAAMRRVLKLPETLDPQVRSALMAELAVQDSVPESGGRGAEQFHARSSDYGGDLLAEAERYARFCVAATRGMAFDVIHAHDWLTYPAGLAVARMTGKPLVVHVHSTEFDRSGEHVNQPIYNIERRGMHGAVRVITVSMLTRNLCVNRYGVNPDKIDVVYNGVDLDPRAAGVEPIRQGEKVVLYFGRITMQKGPEYFIAAAKRVLDVMDGVKFVVAGNGDQAQRMIEMAAAMGIGNKVLFTGFLRGKDIQKVFSIADLYVMPSVSEPFGIAPLEAMGHKVPVIISRTSGVGEILTNVLKCDFWDVDDMANKIVAVLRHPPLQRTLRDSGYFEVRGITWDGAAAKVSAVYDRAMAAVKAK
jgi:glycosyltransferase involved in cell wall biosynthesis